MGKKPKPRAPRHTLLEVGDPVGDDGEPAGIVHEVQDGCYLIRWNDGSFSTRTVVEYIPTPEQIAERAAGIAKGWNKRRERERRVQKVDPVELSRWTDFAPEEPHEFRL